MNANSSLNVKCHFSWPPKFLHVMKHLGRFTEDYQNPTVLFSILHTQKW